jgi:putative transposase
MAPSRCVRRLGCKPSFDTTMRHYIRTRTPGAIWFFTANLAERQGNRLLVERIDLLRAAFAETRHDHPFTINAIVVLPDHLHTIWTLPQGDGDYATRWSLIKARFSRSIEPGERVSRSRERRRERGIWQRRYYEHQIRDDRDLAAHVDYIHWNPVKHGFVARVEDWPHSSFHRYVRDGLIPPSWAVSQDTT